MNSKMENTQDGDIKLQGVHSVLNIFILEILSLSVKTKTPIITHLTGQSQQQSVVLWHIWSKGCNIFYEQEPWNFYLATKHYI